MQLSEVKRILAELQLAPSKLRGQNFLISESALDTILQFAEIPVGTRVLEIGPGLGALTERLLSVASVLCVVEIDRGFAQYLSRRYESDSRVSVFCGDARETSFASLGITDERHSESGSYLVSNVPYSISTDMLLWAVSQRANFASGCFLLQREFAERVGAAPNSKAYGSLSVLFQQYFEFSLGPVLSGGLFYPPAKVESRLIRFQPRVVPLVEVRDPIRFESFVRGLFGQRRKTLFNNSQRHSANSMRAEVSREQIDGIFKISAIDPNRRAETLTIAEFAALFEAWEEVCPATPQEKTAQ